MARYKVLGKGKIVNEVPDTPIPVGTEIIICKPQRNTTVFGANNELFKPHYMVAPRYSPHQYFGVQFWEIEFDNVHYENESFITKKQFNECVSYHQYGDGKDCFRAAFVGKLQNGYKFMTYERGTTKKKVLKNLYDGVKDWVLQQKLRWWMSISENGKKVPITSRGLIRWGEDKQFN